MHPLFDLLRKNYPDNLMENFLDANGLRVSSFKPEDDLIAAHLAAQADQFVKEDAEKAAQSFTALLKTIITELNELSYALNKKVALSGLESSVVESLVKMRDVFYPSADGATIVVSSDHEGTFIQTIIFTKNGGELSFNTLSPTALEAMKKRLLATGWVTEPGDDTFWEDTFESWYVEFPPLPYGTHDFELDD